MATPHHGARLASGRIGALATWLVTLPVDVFSRAAEAVTLTGDQKLLIALRRPPTAVDNMNPENPGLKILQTLRVDPRIPAHSIIAVKGDGPKEAGDDGVVAYPSLPLSEAIGFRLEKPGPEEMSLITFRSHKITPAVEQDIRFVRTVLGIKPQARELTLTFGAIPRNDQELAVLTRSMLEILLELSARIEAPATDVQAGRTFPVPPVRSESGPRDQPLVNIHAGAEPPAEAFVAVRYSHHAFWIDNRDFRSKAIFTFLLLLTSLAQTGGASPAPVITVPAS